MAAVICVNVLLFLPGDLQIRKQLFMALRRNHFPSECPSLWPSNIIIHPSLVNSVIHWTENTACAIRHAAANAKTRRTPSQLIDFLQIQDAEHVTLITPK